MKFPIWLPALLGLLTAVGPVSTDMYLPAFPSIEASLGLSAGTAQITLATWFLGLSIGQITQGPLSDRFGRRAPLLVGTAIYALASAGCAMAGDLTTLAVLRLVAALGGSASMVITRAVVRDVADGLAAARVMSRLTLVMGAAPILAPTLGGWVLEVGSWHIIFWICAGYGVLCCLLVWFLLPDTLPTQRRQKLGFIAQIVRYRHIIGERGFLSHGLMASFGLFGIFAYLSTASAVFIQQFGMRPRDFGTLFGVCAAAYVIAAQFNPMILRRVGADVLLRVQVRVFLATTVVLLFVAATGVGGWIALAAPVLICMGCQGLNLPNSMVGAMSAHPAHAGSASALLGTLQFGMGAVAGVLAGFLHDGTPVPMAALMLLGAAGAAAADLFRPRPRGHHVASVEESVMERNSPA